MFGRGITQYTENVSGLSFRVSPSHPLQAGQDSDGGVGCSEEMCTQHAVVVLCFWYRHRTKISRGGLKGAAQRFIILCVRFV